MQIDKIFSTQFVDPTTRTPITDLTGVTITILEIANDGTTASVPVSTASCANGTLGFYRYYFAGMQDKLYEYYFNPNDARVQITAGFVDKRLNNLDGAISDIRAGGGGGGQRINYSTITGPIKALDEKLTREIEIMKGNDKEIYDKINETDSHIELAKTDVINTIESIEKADEKEAKKAIKLITTLDKKVSTYIDSEKKEKEEIGAIASEFTRMEMEDAKKEKEKELEEKRKEEEEKKMEEESDKKLLEEIQKEFDSQEEQEKEEKKKELEKELEETLKEAKEIEKELNSIK